MVTGNTMVNTDNIHSSGVSKVTGMVHVLEKAILDRQYLQGTLMPSQNELCRLYGVSARTMREAFKILEAKGLVTVSQGRRPYVNTNSLDQYVDSISASMKTRGRGDQKFLEDLLDTHAGLEASSVKTLCASEDRLLVVKKLESMLVDMRKDVDLISRYGSSEAVEDFRVRDFSFHSQIVECSDNRIMKSLYKSFLDQLRNLISPVDESLDDRRMKLVEYGYLSDAVAIGDRDLSSSLVQVIAGRMRRRLKSSAGTEAIKEA